MIIMLYWIKEQICIKDYVYNDKYIDWDKLSIDNPYDNMKPIIEKIDRNTTETTNKDVTITIIASIYDIFTTTIFPRRGKITSCGEKIA